MNGKSLVGRCVFTEIYRRKMVQAFAWNQWFCKAFVVDCSAFYIYRLENGDFFKKQALQDSNL
jgi:hypothetical protein